MPVTTQEHPISKLITHAVSLENVKAQVSGGSSYIISKAKSRFLTPEIIKALKDAGVADAGVADAGVADAGVADAGVADAGVADAGVAGSLPDTLDFNTGPINFSGGTPVSGWGHIKLYKTGITNSTAIFTTPERLVMMADLSG
jgi:hypothetical protein